MTGRANPYNFGGDSESDSSTDTTSSTTNNTYNQDKRNVASDAAVAISGSGNSIDRSTSSLTSFIDSSTTSSLTSFVDSSTKDSSTKFTDNSNRSTTFTDGSNRSTTFTDSSTKDASTHFTDFSTKDSSTKFTDNSTKDSSTKFTDNSNRSVTTVNTNTDYGSVNGSLTLAGSMTGKAFDVAGLGVAGAIDVLKKESDNGLKAIGMAFDSVGKQSAMSQASSAATLGFASDALRATQSAMQDAKDGGQSKMVMTAIIAAGAVAVAFALK
ncbi:hypothetical protein KVP70_25845 [Duganella sp. HSC-15S17]|nr:hypothetical protein [Duganella violaceicalia]MBV6324363.1 hypothetical protein [Duganella violaceicalia]